MTELLTEVPAHQVVAKRRNLEKSNELHTLVVLVREVDYNRLQTVVVALKGADNLIRVSAVEPWKQFGQNNAVIYAAVRCQVGRLHGNLACRHLAVALHGSTVSLHRESRTASVGCRRLACSRTDGFMRFDAFAAAQTNALARPIFPVRVVCSGGY